MNLNNTAQLYLNLLHSFMYDVLFCETRPSHDATSGRIQFDHRPHILMSLVAILHSPLDTSLMTNIKNIQKGTMA